MRGFLAPRKGIIVPFMHLLEIPCAKFPVEKFIYFNAFGFKGFVFLHVVP